MHREGAAVRPWALVVAVVGGVLTAEAGGLFYLAGPEDDLAAVSALGVLILLLGLAGLVVAFLVRRKRVSRTVLLGIAALAFVLSAFALAGIMIDHETPIVSVVYLLPAALMMIAGLRFPARRRRGGLHARAPEAGAERPRSVRVGPQGRRDLWRLFHRAPRVRHPATTGQDLPRHHPRALVTTRPPALRPPWPHQTCEWSFLPATRESWPDAA